MNASWQSIEIIRRPKSVNILNYKLHADTNGRLKVAVKCRPVFPAATNDTHKIVAKLYADEQ